MAGADNVVFSALEKPKSADWNDAQALEARTLMTILRYWNMSRLSGIGITADIEAVHPVINGLQVIPDTNNVIIQPGFMLQDSASLSPTPGTYDSSYRVALNLSNLSVVAPAPVGNTYYLLEAQMQELTASESREFLNTTSGNFTPSNTPKIRTRVLNTQWVTGSSTAYPNPTGGNWVVLAGVYRPGGGGAVNFADIQDMRLQPDLLVGEAHIERTCRPVVNTLRIQTDGDTAVRLSASEAFVYTGVTYNRALRLHARVLQGSSPSGWDPSSALIKDTTTTFAADSWYYVYLTHWKGLAPRMFSPSGLVSRGVVVCSHIAPNSFTSSNSAALNLPNPFAGTVPAGEACLIGILRRDSGNTGWMAMHGCGDTYRFTGLSLATGAGPQIQSGFAGSTISVAAADVPVARLIKFKVDAQCTLGGGPAALSGYLRVFVRPSGGSAGDEYALWRIPMPGANTTQRITIELEAPYSATGYNFFVDDNLGTVVTGGTTTIHVMGFTL